MWRQPEILVPGSSMPPKKCLFGIMSRKIFNRDETGKEHDIAKYFVPAGVIADFMPARYRF
jgi:hypothetical protein